MLNFNEFLAEEWDRFKPKKWYHASTKDFDTFDVSTSDLGSHFGSLEQANNVIHGMRLSQEKNKVLYHVKLGVYNPLRLTDVGGFHADHIADQLYKKKLITKEQLIKYSDKNSYKHRKEYDSEVRNILLDKRYDGVVYSNKHEGKGSSMIVFKPEDIKVVKKEYI